MPRILPRSQYFGRSFFPNLFLSTSLFFALGTLSFYMSTPAYALAEKLSDEELLNKLQKHAFQYFLFEKNPDTGLVYDYASNGTPSAAPRMASMAATGFGLTAYGVGVKRGWVDYGTAKTDTIKTLKVLLNGAEERNGFFYHFVNPRNGKRAGNSELSPIDTAWLLAGVLFAAEYYGDHEIRELAEKIYERVNWSWMLHQGKTFALAWDPENGFSRRRWDHFDESTGLYLLALGSTLYPISPESWNRIARSVGSYRGRRVVMSGPLFTHQYTHIWFDLRNQNDGLMDYFENSRQSTLIQKQFAIDQSARFSSYAQHSWGLTASNGPFGYKAYGAPPGFATHDGTIAPTACISSIVFTPEESLACARYFYENLKDRLWGKYGFSDAFNLDKNWFDNQVIGIDQGAILLMIENYRSGLIWETMKKSSIIQRGKKSAGFKPGTIELAWPKTPVYEAAYVRSGIQADGYLRDWPNSRPIILGEAHRESGGIDHDQDFSSEVRFAWDENAFYVMTKVKDQSLIASRTGTTIWQDDGLEIFLDSQGDGLLWEDSHDYQIGVRSPDRHQEVTAWSWFQGGKNPMPEHQIEAGGFSYEGGYVLEAALRWNYIEIEPEEGKTIFVSVAVHDADRDKTQAKLQWFFRPEEDEGRFYLGKVILMSDQNRKLIAEKKGTDEKA